MTALARVAAASEAAGGVELLPLHGSLTADEQDRAIAPAALPSPSVSAASGAQTSCDPRDEHRRSWAASSPFPTTRCRPG